MRNRILGSATVCVVLAGFSPVWADDPPVKAEAELATPAAVAVPSGSAVIVNSDGTATPVAMPATSPPGQPGQPMPPGTPGGPPGGPGGPGGKPPVVSGKPGEPGKPGEKKPDEAKPGETKPGEPIQHPTKPPAPPKPEELKVRPDANGKVRFNFNGQPWPAVMEWLAQISGMSLDWQEMPGDFLNLSTQHDYTVPEVRDLINRHLLARGFTLLSHGEMLSVVNIKKLDLSLVPRVEPEELKSHQPHEFVKVSLVLEKMTADMAAEELKPLVSPNGKLIPVRITNRLEAVDSVENLREIYALLQSDKSPAGQQRTVKEFILQYARAEEVREQLDALLGKDKGGGMPQIPGQGGQNIPPEVLQQLQQQQQEMARRGGNPQGGQPGAPGQTPAPQMPVSFVVNARKNSLLVYAPPDKMALITQIVDTLDVPVGPQASLLANVARTQVYRLTGIEPETLVKTLREIGNLDPTTNLQIDRKNKAILVTGPMADHAIIRTLVDKLSGSERQFAVRRLRRLAADHVAGTVEFMINGDKKDKNTRSPYYFGGYSSNSEQTSTSNAFRVDADVEHNQLILWANDVELGEVDNLLRKLGEVPIAEGPGATRRIIETAGSEEAKALLERIQHNWDVLAPNPLEIKAAEPKTKSPAKSSDPSAMQLEEKEPPQGPPPAIVRYAQLGGEATAEQPLVSQADKPAGSPSAADAPQKTPPKSPPVKIEMLPDGRLSVTSDDPQALDLFEDMADQLADAKKDYKVFQLKYCFAYGVALNLEEFFKEEKKSGRSIPFWMEMEYGISNNTDDKSGRLSKRRPLRFITDSDTNSILVQGADEKQLQTIEELIKLYDQPLPADAQSVRKTESITVEYSKATVVAETVKEVYRDLLSTNDKAFGGKGDRDGDRGFSIFFDSEDSKKKEQKTPKFKGLLSIGVDEVSNTIVLSAPTYLFDQVKKMIVELDQAAAPAAQMKVIKLGPGMRGPDIRRQLLEALGQEPPKEDPEKKNRPDPNAQQNNQRRNGFGNNRHSHN